MIHSGKYVFPSSRNEYFPLAIDTGVVMSAVRYEIRPDNVGLLTIDQPQSRANILSRALWDELAAALNELETAHELRGLVIVSGKPDIFIAGADLKFFAALPGPNDPATRSLSELGLAVLAQLESMPFPTCAAIDGAALGGGLEVALACDTRLVGMNPRVELGLPEVNLGLLPGWGGTQRLPRIVGLEKACEMIATGRPLGTTEAHDCGLVDAIVQSEALCEFACRHVLHDGWRERRDKKREPMSEADRLRFQAPMPSGPPAAREAMLLLTNGPGLPLRQALALETEAFVRLAGSADSQRCIAEFFASRKKKA